MQHIAHDGDGEVGEIALVVADGVHVQQRLRGVGVAAVTRVDHMHMRRHMLRNQVGRTRFAVAHHKNIRRHGAEVGNRIEQRLTLGRAGARDVQVDDVSRQARGGDLERGAGAGAVLKKQVEHAFAAQQRHFFDLAVAHRDKVGRGIQDVHDQVTRQAFGGQQVNQFTVFVELGVVALGHGRARQVHQSARSGLVLRSKRRLPSSVRARASDWVEGRLTRAAAKSGWMGNSRPPRSTSTASLILAGRP